MLGEHIVPQSEVIRAILLEDSPYGVPHRVVGRPAVQALLREQLDHTLPRGEAVEAGQPGLAAPGCVDCPVVVQYVRDLQLQRPALLFWRAGRIWGHPCAAGLAGGFHSHVGQPELHRRHAGRPTGRNTYENIDYPQ